MASNDEAKATTAVGPPHSINCLVLYQALEVHNRAKPDIDWEGLTKALGYKNVEVTKTSLARARKYFKNGKFKQPAQRGSKRRATDDASNDEGNGAADKASNLKTDGKGGGGVAEIPAKKAATGARKARKPKGEAPVVDKSVPDDMAGTSNAETADEVNEAILNDTTNASLKDIQIKTEEV